MKDDIHRCEPDELREQLRNAHENRGEESGDSFSSDSNAGATTCLCFGQQKMLQPSLTRYIKKFIAL